MSTATINVNGTKKEVVRSGPVQDYIADGAKVGNIIFLSGQVSVDVAGMVVGEGNFVVRCA